MCLIVQRERRAHLPGEVIDYNEWLNPDGFGLAWRDRGKLMHERFGPSDFREFRALLEHADSKRGEYVAHFRRATHGGCIPSLAHPFSYDDPIEGEVLVFHNGVIDIGTGSGESDTEVFVKYVLAKMESGWWRNPAYHWLIEASTGWSRFAIMTATETVRLREEDWIYEKGIHYSTNPWPSAHWKKGATTTINYTASSGKGYLDPGTTIGDYKKLESGVWVKVDDDDDDERAVQDALRDMERRSKKNRWDDGDGKKWDAEPTAKARDALADGWSDGLHWVHAIKPYEGDTFGEAECATCHVSGNWYLWDGDIVSDIVHDWSPVDSIGTSTRDEAQRLLAAVN